MKMIVRQRPLNASFKEAQPLPALSSELAHGIAGRQNVLVAPLAGSLSVDRAALLPALTHGVSVFSRPSHAL